MARVRSVISRAAATGSGINVGPVSSGRILTPAMSSHIWWLKYHGSGTITSSPGAARVAMAAVNAMLQPEVMAT